MPLSQLEHDTVSKLCALTKNVLADWQPRLASLNEVYNATGGVKETLSQDELDEVAVFSDLSKTTLDDAAYALTTTILPAITNSFPSLAQVAARARGFAPPLPMPLAPPPVAMAAPAPAAVEGA
jgi:hypothetical protein